MTFHRLTAATYPGAPLPTHDFINDPAANGDPGAPAPADAKKASGVNEGTYFVAFGEDGTSSDANRPAAALGQNTDILDNVVNAAIPTPSMLDDTTVGALASRVIVGEIFVGPFGTANVQDERDRLIRVLDTATGNELIDASGNRIAASLIHDGAANNVVGTEVTGFYTNPTVNFSPSIPAGSAYRIVYGVQARFSEIANGTFLDALTRETIRHSDVLPGEALKFFGETSRRVGGSVAALACTILETPGIGGNFLSAAAAMVLDVDPSAAFAAGARSLTVRFSRNAVPLVGLTIADETLVAGEVVWSCTDTTLRIADVNTIASAGTSGTDSIKMTGDGTAGDDYLRTYEQVPTAEPSLLAVVNSRWTVTCGDGTNTFGDFNGANALQQALGYIAGHPLPGTGARVLMKAGAYTIGANYTVPEGSYIIEGVDREAVVITNNVAGGAAFGSWAGGTTYLELRNLTLRRGTGGWVGLLMDDVYVRLVNCKLTDQAIVCTYSADRSLERHAVEMHRCHSTMTVTSATSPLSCIMTADGLINTWFVRDSYIQSPHDTPLFHLQGDCTSAQKSNLILFERCSLDLGRATTLAGDFVGNAGVFACDQTTDNLTFESVEYIDCNVRANVLAAAGCDVLLYLRTYDGAQYTTIKRFVIRGGTWMLSTIDSELTPFYIGSDEYSNTTALISSVEISDITWGHAITSPVTEPRYGAPPAAVNAPATNWANFFVHCQQLKMRNVRWEQCTVGTDGTAGVAQTFTGDLWIRAQVYDVDGVYLRQYEDGAHPGGSPEPVYRVRIDGTAKGEVRNLVVDTDGAGHDPASLGLIYVVPGGNLVLRECTADNGAGAAGIRLDNTSLNVGLKALECTLAHCSRGLYYVESATGEQLAGLEIIGCKIFSNEHEGIALVGSNAASQLNTVRISNNHIYNNGIATSLAGVLVNFKLYGQYGGLVLTDNMVVENNATADADQVRIGSAANLTALDLRGVITGNLCGNRDAAGGNGPGNIHLYTAAGGPYTLGNAAGGDFRHLIGIQTNISVTVVALGVAALHDRADLIVTSGVWCLENEAQIILG